MAQAEQNLGALGWALDSGEVDALDQASRCSDKQMVQNIFQSREPQPMKPAVRSTSGSRYQRSDKR